MTTASNSDLSLEPKLKKELEDQLLDLKAEIEQELHQDDSEEKETSYRETRFNAEEEEENEKFAAEDEDSLSSSMDKEELEEQLEAINEALQRIKDGDYGICVECGKPIDIKKLRAMPELSQCGNCSAH